ncbi:hypothetical protein PENTCL1PPCAC_3488, partial [Pristionchus entomophagus]
FRCIISMVSDEESLSAEESIDNEWPDKYFDFSFDTEYCTSRITLTGLPFELLQLIVESLGLRDRVNTSRSCHALKDAVTSTTWRCPGIILYDPNSQVRLISVSNISKLYSTRFHA